MMNRIQSLLSISTRASSERAAAVRRYSGEGDRLDGESVVAGRGL